MRQDRRTPLQLLPLEDRTVPSVVPGGPPVDPNAYESDRILVQLKPGAPQVLAAVAAGVELERPIDLVDGLWTVRLTGGIDVPAALAAAKASPFVQFAEPDYILQTALTPNDPRYTDGTLYGMNKIGMPAAWDVETDGSSIVVAVIDTGVNYNHADLAANMWTNSDEVAGNGVDDDANGFIDDIRGWDFVSNDNNPIDDNNHGSHVSGTIGAVGNNSVGVAGVNWSAKIMPLKFLGANGSGSTSGALQALNYAVANGAKVSNHSYGGGGFSQSFLNALNAANAAGHLVIAAAGNNGANTDVNTFFPAGYNAPNVVSVAATGSNDVLASFSNYGATSVDLAAPGVSIFSTVANGGYASFSGTSMAAPHVAGAAALVWAADPALTAAELKARLLASTDPIGALNPNRPTVTNGRLNVANAMPDTPGLPTLSVTDATATEGDTPGVEAVFTVTLSAPSSQEVTVEYETADGSAGGADYTPVTGTLTFAPGVVERTVPVPIAGDLEIEPDETFTLNLANPTNATIQDAQGVGTIVDNEASPTLSIHDVSIAEGNAGATAATFTVSLSAASLSDVLVSWATANGTAAAGSDYAGGSGSLTIPAGQLSGTVTVTVNGDTRFEGNDSFFVNLSGAVHADLADSQAVGTIVNDDARPRITINNVSGTEGNSGSKTFTFTVSLTNPSDETVTVQFATANGTATGNGFFGFNRDFNHKSGTVSFSPGQMTQSITVTVRGDTRVEGNETFFVNLSGAANATILDGQGVGTIVNDD
jgi:subtilisin family serine protease